MIDERTEAQASLYVLGALPPDEVREFEVALRADVRLQQLVKQLRGTAGAMVTAFPRVAPPPELKHKILAAVDERAGFPPNVVPRDQDHASWMGWMPWTLAACFALLCVLLISLGQSLRQQAVNLTGQLEEKNAQAIDLQQQLDSLQAHADQQITNYQTRLSEIQTQVLQRIADLNRQTAALTNQLHQQYADAQRRMSAFRDEAEKLRREKKILEDAFAAPYTGADHLATTRIGVLRAAAGGPAGATGASVWSVQDQRGLLVVEGLPPPGPGQSYQLWLIDPKLAQPISGGVLPDSPGGSVRLQFSSAVRVETPERFAISIEPRGGSVRPTRVVMSSN
jgi:anti-sigma-K factor RskA